MRETGQHGWWSQGSALGSRMKAADMSENQKFLTWGVDFLSPLGVIARFWLCYSCIFPLLRSFYCSLVSCLMLWIHGEPQLTFAETKTLFSRNMLSAEVPEKLVSILCRHVCVKRWQMDWKSRTKQHIKRTENQMDKNGVFFHKFNLFHLCTCCNTSAIMKNSVSSSQDSEEERRQPKPAAALSTLALKRNIFSDILLHL